MSEFAQEWPPVWFHDISSALALSKQAEPERRLQDFLATLSAETLRLAVFETTEAAGEALAYATACISALFNDSSTAASDDDFLDRLTPRVYVMLILEGLTTARLCSCGLGRRAGSDGDGFGGSGSRSRRLFHCGSEPGTWPAARECLTRSRSAARTRATCTPG